MAKRGGAARSSVSRGDAEFFKVFLPELHSHQLMIPPDYMKHFNRTIRERVMLKDVDGIIWYVTVEKTENGVFLKNGWPSFVNRHLLSLGEFLVFKYDKGFSFLVKIYSINGCKKEIFAANNNTARVKVKENTKEEMNATHTLGKRASPRNNETGVSLDSSECSFFVSHLAHGKQYQLEIPKGVGQNVHLESQMALRDAKGKEWDVHITTSNDGRVYIGRGYSQFRIDNNLGPKDGCKFTFGAEKSSGVIRVQVLRGVSHKKLRC